MSYTPQTWANGDIITATKLNNIESGVQSVSNSYTPTTWVNGDIITAVKLNNIEQGIANAGGGGSSDFSTAMVTTNGGLELNIGVPYINSNKIETSNYFEDITFEAVLYNGELEIKVMDASNITTSGNISEFVFEILEYKATITGDCTITIS